MMQGRSSKKATSADISWALQYEKNKGKNCNQWPSNRGAPVNVNSSRPYTLEQGLQDIAKAANCQRPETRCVNDGQYQRCTTITVNVC